MLEIGALTIFQECAFSVTGIVIKIPGEPYSNTECGLLHFSSSQYILEMLELLVNSSVDMDL